MELRLEIYVKPGVRSPRVGGLFDHRLIVAVAQVASDGQANRAVIGALANALEIPERAMRICVGASSRRKTIEIKGDIATLRARIEQLRRA